MSQPRKGITLIEVLMAIFVMGIGMMALLSLFPLGALTMAQAIKDDRTTAAVAQADQMGRWEWSKFYNATDFAPIIQASHLPTGPQSTLADLYVTNPTGPGYPVYVDPFGFNMYSTDPKYQAWVGGSPNNMPRCDFPPLRTQPSFYKKIGTAQATLALFAGADDINFDDNGLPPATVDRDYRYSWAYVYRMRNVKDARTAELTVVVYSGRPLQFTGDVTEGETTYSASFVAGSAVVTLTVGAGQAKPDIRRGQWILDANMEGTTPHGYFYRVASVIDTTNPSTLVLVLDSPSKLDSPVDNKGNNIGRLVIMENVVEVFERGVVTPQG
jgi:prepilin-type N-terminal cleavage/methylation domain-containing protein